MPARCWAGPTRSARGPLVANLTTFWQQKSPIVPVSPTLPVRKYCAVYNLAEDSFHGMEEIVSSSRVPPAGRVCFLILNLCPDCA